ncbi:PREDICTED: uncharacterized protein LOC104597869 isoform X2 [Nelumbo nucifera]|nr:PREDICTED: uncharacterized protein LOC104597869 isoform X2 [Nelumbo nucifera]
MKDKHKISYDLRSQSCEMDKDSLPVEKQTGENVRNVKGLHDFVSMDDLINGREGKIGDHIPTYVLPSGEIKLSEKVTKFYTDKSVMECEVPELIVCFKEGPYHVVKDICVDEGVPSQDKILTENGQVDCKPCSMHSDLDVNSDLTKQMVGSVTLDSDVMKSLVQSDCEKNTDSQCNSKDLFQKDEKNADVEDEIAHAHILDKKVMSENMLSVGKLKTEKSCPELTNFDSNGEQQAHNQDMSREGTLANSAVPSPAAESDSSNPDNKVPLNSKVENRSITFDSNPSTSATSGRVESKQKADSPQPLHTLLNTSRLEDGPVESLTASSRSFFIQHGHGESSFSAVGPMSGSITYSGPIPYSGSISLRSDSSTTSNRSFAFPILHSEWNSSPVKMAKADQRHFRKHRRWKMNFLCCSF